MSSHSSKAAQSEAAPNSKLNPFAREFKLNVNAPSFTPGSKPVKPQGSAPPPGRAGQGSGPGGASAPSLPPSQPSAAPRPGYMLTNPSPPSTCSTLLTMRLRRLCCQAWFPVLISQNAGAIASNRLAFAFAACVSQCQSAQRTKGSVPKPEQSLWS